MGHVDFCDRFGKKRKGLWVTCLFCGKRELKRIFSHRGKPRFCTTSCSLKYLNKDNRTTVKCSLCGKNKTIPLSNIKGSKRKMFYCNRRCKEKHQSGEKHPNWNGGKSSYRKRAIEKFGLKCNSGSCCKLKNIPLPKYLYEVDHIDRNRNNNKIENLQVLCVWCHRKKHLKRGCSSMD